MSSHPPASGEARSARTKAQFEAYVALVQTAEQLSRDFTELFKRYDLSQTQYNALRILRGAGGAGLACREISDQLIRHDPDITRMLDRLEGRGLAARARDEQDRRIVRTRITVDGLRLLDELDGPVVETHERQLGHMSQARLRELRAAAEQARSRD